MDKELNPFIGYYLNWQCTHCGTKYGNEPEMCCSCGATRLSQDYGSVFTTKKLGSILAITRVS